LGTPLSRKDAPELVTSGPFRGVRHPFYSGILGAGVGAANALSWPWFFPMALACANFVDSTTFEEHHVTEQFPDAYPAYRHSTKMLVPSNVRSQFVGNLRSRQRITLALPR
jgi:protein-S-isoprenylcysteine O-methyltransferase Ste14